MFRYYDIDFSKLLTWLLPLRMRLEKWKLFLEALGTQIVLTHNSFLRYRDYKLYQLGITSQVCYLEKLLRDRFDFIQRRIVIKDAVYYDPIYIFKRAEEKPIWLTKRSEDDPVYLFSRGETGQQNYDFIIEVPLDVVFDEAEMRAMVNSYICGKRYKIETV